MPRSAQRNSAVRRPSGVPGPTAARRSCGILLWLAATEEQVLDLPTGNFTHFDNVVGVEGDQVRLLRRPEELVFVSAKSTSLTVAPWFRL
jgi:hypothetical protein